MSLFFSSILNEPFINYSFPPAHIITIYTLLLPKDYSINYAKFSV